ncbi:MAG: hemolysin III family protein [Gallionella sp.]
MAYATPARAQSRGEELANSISHAIGLIAALVGTPFLILQAVHDHSARNVVGVSIFAATLLLLYLGSTIYHALPSGKAKNLFQLIEHSAIYLLIAGTYTPFTLGVLHGPWGWALLGVVWALALIGVALKMLGLMSHPIISTGLYLLMGWMIVVAINPMYVRMPATGLALLAAGGVAYTVGVGFFVTDSRLRYGHLVWHLFVMAGSACHYFAVFWYAA